MNRPELSKDGKEVLPRKRSGIPLAHNGDVQFPRPPPWAFPTWNHPMQHPNTEQLLRSASQAIDLALAQSLDSKLKVVDVTLSVKQNSDTAPDSDNIRTSENDNSNAVPTSTGRKNDSVYSNGFVSDNHRAAGRTVESPRPNGHNLEEANRRDGTDAGGHPVKDDWQGGANEGVDRSAGDSRSPRAGDAQSPRAGDSQSPRAGDCQSPRAAAKGFGMEWISVVLTSVAGLNMDDIEQDPHPARSKIHRRVPSTIAMAEVTVSLSGVLTLLS